MKHSTHGITLMGTVTNVNPSAASFTLRCRSNDTYVISVHSETQFRVLRNLDSLTRDRVPTPEGQGSAQGPAEQVGKYVHPERMLVVQAMLVRYGDQSHLQARTVTLMDSDPERYLFEETHWWLNQIARLADEWLDDLFKDRRGYEVEDFAELYRTNLNIIGQDLDDQIQECATLSRLIYGLSSAFLLTGNERYLHAAKAGVDYQRESFRSLSHDGKYCFWHFGKRRTDRGAQTLVASENPDDYGTIALYEQIYALAGLSQYYRITQEWQVLEDIHRTVAAFDRFYLDSPEHNFGGTGGYFSHIDPVTRTPNSEALGDNRLRKNWNSIGDHIPAYLINLILALDPLPRGGHDREEAEKLLNTCHRILETTSRLIVEKFPDPESPYVNERFHADWSPDHHWRWQQNRAIVGHNLKISWNLTRVANYYRALAARESNVQHAERHSQYAEELMALATTLGDAMEEHGLDLVRGGCFDAVERAPQGGAPIQFVWGTTKDFWQQEQGILAYLIMHGATGNPNYLALAREMMAFWNLFFLDHDNRGIYFRVSEEGMPVIQGTYAQKAGHSIAGYHTFELNYLAHIYIRSYVAASPTASGISAGQANFCVFFRPDPASGRTTINVLPDFFAPDALEVASITVNGVPRPSFAPDNFQVQLEEGELGSLVVVEFRPRERQP